MVASKQGSTVTLGDFYRGREITIVHGNNASVFKEWEGGWFHSSQVQEGVSCAPFQSLKGLILWEMIASRSFHELDF